SAAGGLLNDGLDVESATLVFRGVCLAVGDDEINDRLEAILSTAKKQASNEPTTGWNKLRQDLGREAVSRIRGFIGLITQSKPAPSWCREGGSPHKANPRKGVVERLLDLTKEARFYHTPDKETFAEIPVGTHFENWPLRSREFRGWLSRTYYQACSEPAPREA